FSPGKKRGSEFIIRLPVAEGACSLERNDQVPSKRARSFVARRILLVDDYRYVAEPLRKLLTLEGHDVKIADDGPSALAEISNYRPDIALLDIGLPGIDGYELAARIRQQAEYESMILIALTGYGQEEDLHRAWDAGFDFHLTKPIECAVLLELI